MKNNSVVVHGVLHVVLLLGDPLHTFLLVDW